MIKVIVILIGYRAYFISVHRRQIKRERISPTRLPKSLLVLLMIFNEIIGVKKNQVEYQSVSIASCKTTENDH